MLVVSLQPATENFNSERVCADMVEYALFKLLSLTRGKKKSNGSWIETTWPFLSYMMYSQVTAVGSQMNTLAPPTFCHVLLHTQNIRSHIESWSWSREKEAKQLLNSQNSKNNPDGLCYAKVLQVLTQPSCQDCVLQYLASSPLVLWPHLLKSLSHGHLKAGL